MLQAIISKGDKKTLNIMSLQVIANLKYVPRFADESNGLGFLAVLGVHLACIDPFAISGLP